MQARTNHNKAACALANKAACALANKLARICYATLRDKQCFADKQPVHKKIDRQVFAMPA